MALLVAQTVRHGLREGLKTALAPILTDAPIVAVTLLILSEITEVGAVLGAISLAGGLYVIWLGIGSFGTRQVDFREMESAPHSIRKAMAINVLNPHVYLFWATVGAPTVLRAAQENPAAPAAFVTSFYILLCGSKMLLAVLVNRSRALLVGTAYLRTLQALGVVLLIFGAWLIWEGWGYLSR